MVAHRGINCLWNLMVFDEIQKVSKISKSLKKFSLGSVLVFFLTNFLQNKTCYLKKEYITVVFLWILQKFLKQLSSYEVCKFFCNSFHAEYFLQKNFIFENFAYFQRNNCDEVLFIKVACCRFVRNSCLFENFSKYFQSC